jgi:hypothetical protein
MGRGEEPQKRAGGVARGVGLSSNPSTTKKKKKRVKNEIFMEPIFMNFAFQKIVLQ